MADITQDDVRQAQREADADAQKVEALKSRVMSGEDVTPGELATAKQLAEWSELRVEAVRQQAAQAAEGRRQAALAELRDDIEAHLPGDTITAKLRAVEAAVGNYFAAVDAHNHQLGQWRKRMLDLGVPEHTNPIAPPAQHARLGWTDQGLYAGQRRITRIDHGMWLTRALEAARASTKETHIALHLTSGSTPTILNRQDPSHGDLYAKLAALSEVPEITATHFYRGSGGAVIATDKPYSPEDIKRHGMKTITQEEAYGE